jgi:hypothetical protein
MGELGLLMSLVPPAMTKKSFFQRRTRSLSCERVTRFIFAPGFIRLETSNWVLRCCVNLKAAPFKWLSPMMLTICQRRNTSCLNRLLFRVLADFPVHNGGNFDALRPLLGGFLWESLRLRLFTLGNMSSFMNHR